MYLRDLTDNVRSALSAWWNDFKWSSGGIFKICLIDLPLALLLLYTQPFIAAGAAAAWFGFATRRPRPLEGALISVSIFAIVIWTINVAAEFALILVLLAVWDARKNLLQSWWHKNTEPDELGNPVTDPSSLGNRVLLALS